MHEIIPFTTHSRTIDHATVTGMRLAYQVTYGRWIPGGFDEMRSTLIQHLGFNRASRLSRTCEKFRDKVVSGQSIERVAGYVARHIAAKGA